VGGALLRSEGANFQCTLLTIILPRTIVHSVLFVRGASRGRSWSGAGCGVPRACLASTPREARGTVRALLRGLCLEWLDGAAKAGEIPPEWLPQGAHALSRKHGPVAPNPAVARPQAPRSIARWTAPKPTTPAPAGAPLPSCLEGRTAASLGLFGAARVQAAGCLTFESEIQAQRAVLPSPGGGGSACSTRSVMRGGVG